MQKRVYVLLESATIFISFFPVKNMGTAKAYTFRVFSHSLTSYSISDELKYDLPENVKRRAVTAGLIGGLLFFIVAIVLSVCTVKICNKKRRRKQERGTYVRVGNMKIEQGVVQLSKLYILLHGL